MNQPTPGPLPAGEQAFDFAIAIPSWEGSGAPHPSQEGSKRSSASCQFPSWEG